MSETERTPLQIIANFESGAFRVGQVVRRLITLAAENPELTITQIAPSASSRYSYDSAQVDIIPSLGGDLDGVHRWAKALGAEVTVKFYDYAGSPPFDHASCVTEIDGVQVQVCDTRSVPAEEVAARRAAAVAAPAGGAS